MFEQTKSAYREMSERAFYRPAAGDDMTGSNVPEEVEVYAKGWLEDEEKLSFWIGSGDGQTREALIFSVEAARNLCAGRMGDHVALRLLKMAVEKLEKTIKDHENELIYRSLGVNPRVEPIATKEAA